MLFRKELLGCDLRGRASGLDLLTGYLFLELENCGVGTLGCSHAYVEYSVP